MESIQNTSEKQQPKRLLPELAKSNGEVIVDLHILDEPLVDGIAQRLPDKAAAWRFARHAMAELFQQIEPRLAELEAENEKLRQALVYHYTPTSEEIISFDEHCNMVRNAGDFPPDENAYWSEVALSHWKHNNG